eukprot:g78748.t1
MHSHNWQDQHIGCGSLTKTGYQAQRTHSHRFSPRRQAMHALASINRQGSVFLFPLPKSHMKKAIRSTTVTYVAPVVDRAIHAYEGFRAQGIQSMARAHSMQHIPNHGTFTSTTPTRAGRTDSVHEQGFCTPMALSPVVPVWVGRTLSNASDFFEDTDREVYDWPGDTPEHSVHDGIRSPIVPVWYGRTFSDTSFIRRPPGHSRRGSSDSSISNFWPGDSMPCSRTSSVHSLSPNAHNNLPVYIRQGGLPSLTQCMRMRRIDQSSSDNNLVDWPGRYSRSNSSRMTSRCVSNYSRQASRSTSNRGPRRSPYSRATSTVSHTDDARLAATTTKTKQANTGVTITLIDGDKGTVEDLPLVPGSTIKGKDLLPMQGSEGPSPRLINEDHEDLADPFVFFPQLESANSFSGTLLPGSTIKGKDLLPMQGSEGPSPRENSSL